MFRGFMPALTLIVFGLGIGLGLAWSRGQIPIALTSAKTGTLSPEFSYREPLPPPPDQSRFASADQSDDQANNTPSDPEILKNQTEPEPDDSNTSTTSNEQDRPQSAPLQAEPEAPHSDETAESSDGNAARPTVRLRKRGRNTAQASPQTEDENDSPPEKRGKVVPTAHQDANDAVNHGRESKESKLSPREQLTLAEEKLSNGETREAHRELSEIYWNHKDFRPQVQEIIDSTSKAIFFQPKPHYVNPYVVQEGERLEVIAKKYQLSWEYLAKLNRTSPKRIQVGQKLKVMKGPFGAVVDLKDFTLTVHLHGYYVKRYDVGIGKDSSSPVGKFTVLNKIENPQYTDDRTGKVINGDDPANPLGERWIDLGNSYGIHGTIDPDSIGKAESRGCIRLRDNDIVEVYDFLVKGSEVVLRN